VLTNTLAGRIQLSRVLCVTLTMRHQMFLTALQILYIVSTNLLTRCASPLLALLAI
jgi:hypothetical protein